MGIISISRRYKKKSINHKTKKKKKNQIKNIFFRNICVAYVSNQLLQELLHVDASYWMKNRLENILTLLYTQLTLDRTAHIIPKQA